MSTAFADRRPPPVRRRKPASGGPFASTIRLGRVAGVEIGVNWTWLGILALIVWSLAGVEFPADVPGRSWPVYAAMAVAAAAAFFASLTLHELGHAVRARREGVRIEGITLWLFGGVAKMDGRFPSAGAELRIAVAGPAVTLAIATAALAAAAAWPRPGAVEAVLLWLGYINVALLVFNLVPAMPLDGGRVLRSLLWARSGSLAAATHRATAIGGTLATLLIALGIVEALTGSLGGLWLALIGWFVLEAGRAEEHEVVTRDVLGGVGVAAVMTRDVVTVTPEQTLAQVASRLEGTARHTAYPVVSGERVAGLLPLHALASTPRAAWDSCRVADRMLPPEAVTFLRPEMQAAEAFDVLAGSGNGRGVVTDAAGRLTGILSVTDLVHLLAAARSV